LRHIFRTVPRVKTVPGVPMQSPRVHDNVDETVCSKWADAHEITVPVPTRTPVPTHL
jgi:hypothetical protein